MIIRSVVDFPDPFGPRNPVTVPGRTVNESRSTATAGPYLLVRSCTSIIDPCPPSGTRCVCLREITLGTGGPGRNPARPRLLVRGYPPYQGAGRAAGRWVRPGPLAVITRSRVLAEAPWTQSTQPPLAVIAHRDARPRESSETLGSAGGPVSAEVHAAVPAGRRVRAPSCPAT